MEISRRQANAASLPSDILIYLFIHLHSVLGGSITSTLVRVCSSWRAAALSTSRLWTTIDIDLARVCARDIFPRKLGILYEVEFRLYEYPADYPKGHVCVKSIQAWLERSGTISPLHISLRSATPVVAVNDINSKRNNLDLPSNPLHPFYQAAFSLIEAHRGRWRSLQILEYPRYPTGHVTYARLPLKPLVDKVLSRDCPQLAEIHVQDDLAERYWNIPQLRSGIDLPSLTNITVENEELVSILPICPGLRSITANTAVLPRVLCALPENIAANLTFFKLLCKSPSTHFSRLRFEPDTFPVNMTSLSYLEVPFTDISWLQLASLTTLRMVSADSYDPEDKHVPAESVRVIVDPITWEGDRSLAARCQRLTTSGVPLQTLHLGNIVIKPAVALRLLRGIPLLRVLRIESVTWANLTNILTTINELGARGAQGWLLPNLREVHASHQPLKDFIIPVVKRSRCTVECEVREDVEVQGDADHPARLRSLTWDGVEQLIS